MRGPTDNGRHILAIYREFVEVFSKELETVAPHRSINHAIDLEHGYNLPYRRITTEWSWVEDCFQISWVQQYSHNCVDKDHVLKRPDDGFGFGVKDPMPYGRIDEWVFSNNGWYVTTRITGLRWRVNWRRTFWRLVNIPLRGLTEMQEQAWNAAETSAITHQVDTNSSSQMDCHQMDHSQRWMTVDGTCPGLNRWRKWIKTGSRSITGGAWPEVGDSRWISGNGSWETADNWSHSDMKILRLCEIIRFLRSWLWFWTTNCL